MADTNRLEAFLVEAKRLRTAAAESEADFLAYLADAEADPSIWRGSRQHGTGYATFEELLRNEPLTTPDRLSRFKVMRARFGIERVRAIGVDVCARLLAIPDDAPSRVEPKRLAIETAIEDAEAFVERNGTVPVDQTGRHIVAKHYEPPKQDRSVSQEVLELRERVAVLSAENALMRKALGLPARGPVAELLRERSGGAHGPGGARKATNRRGSAEVRTQA